ncbi:MAG: hypothetical protein HY895_22510 [Deltaproteobacteria bacterium]|nr:hypothetical protein [Deltaproteobacteria bacterium]
MIKQVWVDPKIEKSLQMLRRCGKKAALAVLAAQAIVARMRSGDLVPARVGTVTKHGELRIKGVMKYDLGSGYRLVTFKHGRRLFVLYVGTHDDCHRWIENNRDLTVVQVQERCTPLPIEAADDSDGTPQLESIREEEDCDPLPEIPERVLRRIFSGLVGNPVSPSSL